MTKKINFLLFIILSLSILLMVTKQSLLQHWSAQWDLDFWYIYNASLMSSGIQQEWYDHPATTIFSLYSFFYKIYSLFDHSFIYKINEIVESNNPDLLLQKLYFVTRIFDSINIILIIFFTFKISKILSSKDIYAYFLTLILISSVTFLDNISLLNPEDWAVLFFLMSFYYFIRFFIESKITFLILSGMFFSFSFFSKISILFMFLFIIPLIPIFYQIYATKNSSLIQKIIDKKFLILFIGYLLVLIIYSIIQIFVFSKLTPFEANGVLDVVFILFINFSYIFFFLIISKFNTTKFKTYFLIFLLFMIGFLLGLVIFLLTDFLNLTKLNPWLIFHLTNPFNEMMRFSISPEGSISSTDLVNSTSFYLSQLFSQFLFDKFLLIILIPILSISLFKDIKNKNTYNFIFKLIIFVGFMVNVLLFNFRFWIQYSIYVYVLYIILVSSCLKDLSNKINYFVCIILFSYTLIFLPIQSVGAFKLAVLTKPSQLERICKTGLDEFKIYSKEFNKNTYKKLCS